MLSDTVTGTLLFWVSYNLAEKDELVKPDKKTAETWNSFFSNVVHNLLIYKFPDRDIVNDPTSKFSLKYREHFWIFVIKNDIQNSESLKFCWGHRDRNRKIIFEITFK